MKVSFNRLAEAELIAAACYLEAERKLGSAFLDEYADWEKRVRAYPESCPKIAPGIRCGYLPRFKYHVTYALRADGLRILYVLFRASGPATPLVAQMKPNPPNPASPMSDIVTPAQRSANMARIRGRGNASTELKLVAVFRVHGVTGWRRGFPLTGKPDFVFPKLKLAVFVDGCFWHGCPLHATQPKQNAEFWQTKIAKNQLRDRLVTRTLRARGWRVFRLWEHELTRRYETRLLARLRRFGLIDVSR